MDSIDRFIKDTLNYNILDVFHTINPKIFVFNNHQIQITLTDDAELDIIIVGSTEVLIDSEAISVRCIAGDSGENEILHTKIFTLIRFLSWIYCRDLTTDLFVTDSFDHFNPDSYLELSVDELINMRSSNNLSIYEQLPILPIKFSYTIVKSFHIILPNRSKSDLDKILITISEKSNVYVSCGNHYRTMCLDTSVGGSIESGVLDRTGYDYNCKNMRNMKGPLQNGKEMARTLYFLAWLTKRTKLTRTDVSRIGECLIPVIFMRLATGREPLLVEDGFRILDPDKLKIFNRIKSKILNDDEFRVFSYDYFENINNPEHQKELCESILYLFNRKYSYDASTLSSIKFTKDITDADKDYWINKWI